MMRYCSRRQRDSAENFREARSAQRREAFRFGKTGGGQSIGDRDEFVRICSWIAVSADRRSYRVDGCRTVVVDNTGDVAQAIGLRRPRKSGGGIISGWIIRDRVWHSQTKAGLQRVGQVPFA